MMKQQKLLKLLFAFLLGGLYTPANAQKTMDVSGFTRDDADMMARITKPVHDNDEGKLCALIRVETALKDLDVRADALGIVQKEEHTGEIWLYVPYGAKSLSFYHEGYFSLLYQYEIPIESGVVYKLQLESFDTPPSQGEATQTQMFVLTHNPDEATVIIDDMEVPTENGVFAAMMSKGKHNYKVKAPQYEEKEGDFVLGDYPVRETVTLEPLFATFQINTQPKDGFHVYVNDNYVGTSPYKSGKIYPGIYKIRLEDKDYFPIDTIIRVRRGDNVIKTIDMKNFLIWDDLLGGRNVSFGVHAGYVLPFATSSAGGSFTGSPVNYSLGDSRENVNYYSQSGFTAGLAVDIRLYKNFYLMTGLNYTQVKYSNKFIEPISNDIISISTGDAYVGNRTNNFEEKYTINMLELPILASYRFVLNHNHSIHLNLGPYVTYGLSAKMKLSGSSDCSGNIYYRGLGGDIDYNTITGSFTQNYHISGDFDLYSKALGYEKTNENAQGIGSTSKQETFFDDSPYNKLNFGLKMGVVYEIRGFQIGLNYNLQLSNMANKDFWESSRVPVFNKVGTNNMSGYKHRVHSLEIKVGYIFRY